MAKLLLVCHKDAQIIKPLQEIAHQRGDLELIRQDAKSIVESTAPLEGIQGIIFDCNLLSRDELAFLMKISQLFEHTPILIMANQISLYSYRKVDLFKNMVAIQKPFDNAMCISLLQKMMTEEDFSMKPNPRFITDETVRVVHLKSGLVIPTRMRNYSMGGAFLEYKGLAVKAGDEVQMNISRGTRDNLQMTAKVVWTRDGDHSRSPLRGIGVQFKN